MIGPLELKKETTLAVSTALRAIARGAGFPSDTIPPDWWHEVRIAETTMDVKDYVQLGRLVEQMALYFPVVHEEGPHAA